MSGIPNVEARESRQGIVRHASIPATHARNGDRPPLTAMCPANDRRTPVMASRFHQTAMEPGVVTTAAAAPRAGREPVAVASIRAPRGQEASLLRAPYGAA